MIKKIISIALLSFLLSTLWGCKKEQTVVIQHEPITLTYYKLFDNDEIVRPIFDSYQIEHPYVEIIYKKFTDPEEYLNTIISEIAEGGGPDVMSVPNTWIAQNYKKLAPAPDNFASAEKFNDTFVNVAFRDNVLSNAEGVFKIYGVPMYVDTLALYYNDSIFEKTVPERGKPASTWKGFINDVNKINKIKDNQIIRSAIALGRGDNINRAADIFYLLLAQNDINFYKEDYSESAFAQNSKSDDVLNFINDFANPKSNVYSWNSNLAQKDSAEKEIIPFVQGKTAMMFGYSYQYKEILKQINLQNLDEESGGLQASDLKIIEVPQFANSENKVAFANYMTETVSRNSKYPEEAWALLGHMVKTDNLKIYYKNEYKPTSKRELLPEQENNPIYKAFANQISYAISLPMIDNFKYKKIINNLINKGLENELNRQYLIQAQSDINQIIPGTGVYPFVH